MDLEAIKWSQATHDEDLLGGSGDQWMMSVVVGGPGLVAVGGDASGGDADAAVWLSVDGLAWERVAHVEPVFGGAGDQWMEAVTVGGPGLVAVGNGDAGWGVWVSADGLAWDRVSDGPGAVGIMRSVTVGGPGLVAGGEVGDDAALWLSTDGYTWSRVAGDSALFGGPGQQSISSVSAGGPGLVAVGSVVPHLAPGPPIWLSSDGLTWVRAPAGLEAFDPQATLAITSVVAGGPGLVAAGYEESEYLDAAVWVSTDGYTWTRLPRDDELFGGLGNQEVTGLTAVGNSLVAVGYDWTGQSRDAAAWVSTDGLTWTKSPDETGQFGGPDLQQLTSVVAWGTMLVAVGYDGSGGDWDAAVWLAAPTGF